MIADCSREFSRTPPPAPRVSRNRYHIHVNSLPESQALLIDADDTLWENNIYFERAIADFISFLNHRERSPAEVREILNDVERECIVSHGYGLHSFAHALAKTFERISVEPLTDGTAPDHPRIRPHHRRAAGAASATRSPKLCSISPTDII